MALDTHEEEQVEAIKKWWKENGTNAILGLVIGFALLSGWRYWQGWQQQQTELASLAYEQTLNAAYAENNDGFSAAADKVLSGYPNSTYAVFTSLLQAQQALKKGQIESALASLTWVIKNSKMTSLKEIAHLRTARLHLSQAHYSDARQSLEQVSGNYFMALKADIEGDLWLAENKPEQAADAYDKALSGEKILSPAHKAWIQMKREQLGNVDKSVIHSAQLSSALAMMNTHLDQTLTTPVSRSE